jgi:Na+-driven multidrug efflux pump
MKKLQLVELGIIATALIMMYKMITSLLTLVTSLLFGFGTGIGRNLMMAILPTALLFAFYTITFFLLARNIKPLARFICRDNKEFLEFKLNKVAMLHVIIIAICLSSFLQTIPDVIQYIASKFIGINQYGEDIEPAEWRAGKIRFWNSLIGFIISLALLITSKNIASFFGNEEPSYEIGGEKIESNP